MGKKTGPKGSWKMTADAVDKLEEIFRIDGTIAEACSYADIHPTTYHQWILDDEEFSYRMAKAKEYPFIVARKTLFKAIAKDGEKGAIEFLKRRDKRYSEKQEVEQTNIEGQVTEEDLTD